MKKNITIGIVILILVGTIGYLYVKSSEKTLVGAVSPVGTSNAASRFFSTVMNLSSAAGTTTSILNNTGYDIAVNDTRIFCTGFGTSQTFLTGTGLTNFTFQFATTSVSGLGIQNNTNYFGNDQVATNTGAGITYVSSSTEPVLNTGSRIIPNGTYATITANATNTAQCVVAIAGMAL